MTMNAVENYILQNPKSKELFQRSSKSLPGANTRTVLSFPPFPFYIDKANGCRIIDIDGNERIDFINNYTSYILGHSHPKVIAAIKEQLGKITAVAAPTEPEVLLAEEIKRRLPSVHLVRFCNSGTEATMLGIRAARMFTKREIIVRMIGSYHGSHDYASVHPGLNTPNASLSYGIPPGTTCSILFVPFNDIPGTLKIIEPLSQEIAAVLIEPIMGIGVLPASPDYISFLRDFTNRTGSLLIFDEVISFRISYHGAQGEMGITPDLTTLGKIIGGGLPIGAVGGRADIMELFNPSRSEGIVHGGTFNGNPLTMAAGLSTLRELTPDVFKRLSADREFFCGELRALFLKAGIPVQILESGSLFCIHFSEKGIHSPRDMEKFVKKKRQELFHLVAINRGVMLAPRGLGCLSTVMTREDLMEAVHQIELTLRDLKELREFSSNY